MKTQSRIRRMHGFTLMELLVVVSIIVILAGLTIGAMGYVNQKQAREKARVQIGLLQVALQDYYSDHGEFPASRVSNGKGGTAKISAALFPRNVNQKTYLPQLDPENDNQGWTSGTGTQITIVDPWGNEYYYRTNDDDPKRAPFAVNPDFDLWSAGPDGSSSASKGDYDPNRRDNRDDIRGW